MNDPYVVYESTGVFIPIVKLIQLKHTPNIRPFGTQAQKLQGGRRGSKGGQRGSGSFRPPSGFGYKALLSLLFGPRFEIP